MSIENRYNSYSEAVDAIGAYEFALLYKFSELKLCQASDVTEKDLEECIEGRLFNTEEELHIFPGEKEFYVVADMEDDKYTDWTYVMGSFNGQNISGNKVIERQYFATDEDGQTYIRATRLVKIVLG